MSVPASIARLAYAGLALVILASIIPGLAASGSNLGGYAGTDYQLYIEATARWLDGGPFYLPYQLAGPYSITAGDILYPPVALWLFAPFTLLPSALWWIIPIGLTAWSVWSLRPVFVVWPLLALCVAWPPTVVKLATGNPVMWAMAAVAVGVTTSGPAVFALIKPSLAPFALWGIRRRRWWAYLAIFVGLSVPFGLMWGDWVRAIANSQGGIAYSIQEAPMLALPAIAWLGRRYRWASASSI